MIQCCKSQLANYNQSLKFIDWSVNLHKTASNHQTKVLFISQKIGILQPFWCTVKGNFVEV